MNKLNKTFEQGQILTSGELNSITSKVDEIIELLSSLTKSTDDDKGLTPLQIQLKIDEAKNELKRLLDEQVNHLKESIKKLEDAEEGASEVVDEKTWAQYRAHTDELMKQVAAIELTYKGVDITALKEDADKINKWASQLTIDPTKISILVSLFDKDNNLQIPPASIIAAIVDKNGNLTSEIGIQADQVMIGGDVTLTGGLTLGRGLNALGGYISDLQSDKVSTAQLDAVNAKINGILNSNQIITNDIESITGTINNLNADVANLQQAIINKLTVASSIKTGDTGYIAEIDAQNNSGYFRIYNSQTNKNTVKISGWDQASSAGYSVGSFMEFSSQDYSDINKTGWQITFGAHGIAIRSYINGKLSSMYLTPDVFGARSNSNASLCGGLQFETIQNSSALYRRTIAGNMNDSHN